MRTRIYIDLEAGAGSALDISSTPDVVNVADTSNLSTPTAFNGFKGFQLSASRSAPVSVLDGSYKPFSENGYKGILTRTISNAKGYFTDEPIIKLKLKGQSTPNFIIVFDQICKEYATELDISVPFTNGSLTARLENGSVYMYVNLAKLFPGITDFEKEITIAIVRWSKPYASAKITRFALSYTNVFSGDSMKQITCSENSRDSQLSLQPGIVEQFVEIELYDRHKNIHYIHEQGALSQKGNIRIVAVDASENEISLGTYLVEDWEIYATDSTVKLIGTDPSVDFDKIYVDKFPIKERTVDDFLREIFAYVPQYNFAYLSATAEDRCKSIVVPNSWLKATTLDLALNKVCTLGMIRVFWLDGEFKITEC